MALKQVYLDKLNTCHPKLIRVVLAVAERKPLIVVCGHRGKEDQDRAYREGKSKLRWPNSRHNAWPSEAVDLAPAPLDWDDTRRFKGLAVAILEEGRNQGTEITWGGSWRGFVDVPHFELTRRAAA